MCLPGYRRFSPLIPKRFEEMTKREAELYFEWFMGQVPVRLEELRRVVASTGGPTDVRPTPESLPPLGRWLNTKVTWYRVNPLDSFADPSGVPADMVPFLDPRVFSEDTYSLCVDIGMLFGETLRGIFPQLRWECLRKPRNDVDYHQPVVVPFIGGSHLNPVGIATVAAGKTMDGIDADDELPRLFSVWRESAERAGHHAR